MNDRPHDDASGERPWFDRLAHDLRNPLTSLQTAAYLLRSGQVSPERQQELFALIERQTRQLGGMIDELGDWTRVAQDRLLGSIEPCEPALLLDYARANSGSVGASAVLEQHAEGVLVGVKRLYLQGQDDQPTGTFTFSDVLARELAREEPTPAVSRRI